MQAEKEQQVGRGDRRADRIGRPQLADDLVEVEREVLRQLRAARQAQVRGVLGHVAVVEEAQHREDPLELHAVDPALRRELRRQARILLLRSSGTTIRTFVSTDQDRH